MTSKWFLPIAAAIGIVLAVVWSLGGQTTEGLAVYSGRGEQFMAPIVEAFQRETGIPVQVLPSGSTELLQRILHEGEGTPCDVYVTNDSATLEAARARKLLAPLPDALLEPLDPRYRAADGTWIAISARVRVVVYDPAQVSPTDLSSVFDLADPRWKGKVGRITSANESFVSGIAAMIADHGAERTRRFLEGVRENTAGTGVFGKHTPIVEAVARGELALGYVNHYYYYRHKVANPGASVQILFPDQAEGDRGAAWNVSGAALLAAAPHPEAGRRFLEFLLSPSGQRIFSEQNFEYPVVPGAPTHPEVQPAASIRLSSAGIEDLGRLRDEAVDLIQAAGLE